MSEQHLHELFIDGLKVDQYVTDDSGDEVKEEEIINPEWKKWEPRTDLSMP